MKIASLVSQIVLGIVFIFSGFVKAVDPMGSMYKLNDYFSAFGTTWMEPLSLTLSMILSLSEFVIGFAILLGLKMKYSAMGGVLFMVIFTPLTLYIALTDPISDCGCFGDAIIMTNYETFFKNIFLFAAAIIVFLYRHRFKSKLTDKSQWGLIVASVIFIAIIMLYSMRHLPIIDFRPWKVGNNVLEKMEPVQEEIIEFTFIYKNENTGDHKEFDVNNLPSSDEGWIYVDRKEKILQEYIGPAITEFVILDEYDYDWTYHYLSKPNFVFLLFAYDLNTASRVNMKKINALAKTAEEKGYNFIGLTASPFNVIDNFRHEVQAAYPFYLVDDISLKTAIRSNPGIILIKEGVVIAKWHHNDTPKFQKVKKRYLDRY